MAENGNGKDKSSALAGLLNKLDPLTLIAIAIFGGGNLIQTKQDGNLTREESRRVINQVQSMYDSLDNFEQRQKDTLSKVAGVLDNQNQLLKNQSMVISNQQKMLDTIQRTHP